MSGAPVSVIIPAFNCQAWIRQAIDSALGQTVAPREVIVVDDGSTDDTRSVLAEYGSKIRALSQRNQGVAAARNLGLQSASGEIIAFLDADDMWHPRKLELQLRTMRDNPSIGLIGTHIFPCPDSVLPDLRDYPLSEITKIGRDELAVKNYLTTSSILVRRELVQRAGEFDTQLQGPEDHDYWLRIAELSNVANLNLPLTGYRSVPGSLSKQATMMEAGMRRILQKLDKRDAWKGRGMLRRKAYSYFNFSCAHMYGVAGTQGTAIIKMLRSFAWYPWPYSRSEAGVCWARPKRLSVLFFRLMGVMRPDPGSTV
jgi:glycosyltransferase involved in cell wall biosynthesis